MRVVELFCGIGGCAAALGERVHIVSAVDVNRQALSVYTRNFSAPVLAANVESIPEERWRSWKADLWWLSPPCQPFTIRGQRRDLQDPRCAGLLAVLERLRECQPRYLALENVPGFVGSQAQQALLHTLNQLNYSYQEYRLCPTELGIPNRRLRYYLVANRDGLLDNSIVPPPQTRTLREFLETDSPDPALRCPDHWLRFRPAMHVIREDESNPVSNCFTSAYGRSVLRSGSYLEDRKGLRHFSPREILRLLQFPETFRLPVGTTPRQAWSWIGNSLSIAAVRHVLRDVPELNRPCEFRSIGLSRPA